MLYGRAGYLSLLAYVKSTFENDVHNIDNALGQYTSSLTGLQISFDSSVSCVIESILNDGIKYGKNINGKFVLKWEWYNTEYLVKVLMHVFLFH